MNYLNRYKKNESLKTTNKILNKTSNQKLKEVLISTLLLILAYDALLLGSDFLLLYYQTGEMPNSLLISKPFFSIGMPAIIGALNSGIRGEKNKRKEFNAAMNLHVIKSQINNNTDIYNLDEEAIKNAKSIEVEVKDKANSKKNISIYAADPYNTIYVDGEEIKSDDIDQITSYKDENRFVYFQEERKKYYGINYYEIKSLDNNLKNSLLEQTNNESINQIFTEKNTKRKIKVKINNNK